VPVLPDEAYASLASRLSQIGAAAVLDVLSALPQRMASASAQQGTPSHAPRLKRSDTHWRWRGGSAAALHTLWRAVGDSWGVYTRFRARRVKLVAVLSPSSTVAALAAALVQPSSEAGAFVFDRRGECVLVRCADGSVAGVSSLLVEGRTVVSARQFCVGYRITADVFQDDDVGE
jgi:methionyl-tRNA formyltransferase